MPSAPKKETVYGGPSVPVKETVFGDPGAPGSASHSNLYNSKFVKTAPPKRRTQGTVFLVIAFLTALNLVLYHFFLYDGESTLMILSMLAVIVVFGSLWIFARQGSSGAYVIGMLLYGADTAFMVQQGLVRNIFSIVMHVILLGVMFRGYRGA